MEQFGIQTKAELHRLQSSISESSFLAARGEIANGEPWRRAGGMWSLIMYYGGCFSRLVCVGVFLFCLSIG